MHLKSILLSSFLATSLTSAYHILVTDQNSKTVRAWDRNDASWNGDNIFWSWTAEGGPWPWTAAKWLNIDEVKIRKTASLGWVALVTTSAGKVGMIDINTNRDTNIDNVLWQATLDGNPHSIERIPNVGAIVVASSDSNDLTVYAPEDPNDVNNLGKIKKIGTYEVEFAHGVLWDPTLEVLWALGRNILKKFAVAGEGPDLTLVEIDSYPLQARENDSYDGNLNGHDLQPSYADDDVLMVTHTRAGFKFHKSTGKWEEVISLTKLKSLVQAPDGEYIWIRGDKGDMGQRVSFSNSPAYPDFPPEMASTARGWDDAKFYKARIYTPDFY
ncbi:hypothetical protein FE257_007984 [Aspergillus nanangensis]|uniref:Uncharacterized protein n=1 Tax=Aspergillus nanangensis TaxID=2582783 RepID=A0AAD4CNW3_ASPNN|nr:hypothetical protein FE257_007984 [Aspergillus nanangensis]